MAEGPQDGPAQVSSAPEGASTRSPRSASRGAVSMSSSNGSSQGGFSQGQRLPEAHRPLPASIDAEKGVLSSILLSPKDTLTTAIEKGVSDQYFHHPAHGTIYAVLEDLWKKNSPIDLITITQTLADRNLLEQV